MKWKRRTDPLRGSSAPDEIQREFWQYRRVWVATIVLLVVGRLILPHIPLLRGWEQKFTASSFELGKLEIPPEALRTSSTDVVNLTLRPKHDIPSGMADFNGPILVAAWPCTPLGDPGECLRYLWDGEPLTVVISFKPQRTSKDSGPFARAGWGGYFVLEKNYAAAAVGPFSTQDILNAWPYAVAFSKHPKK